MPQAQANSLKQFLDSPDLGDAVVTAVADSQGAHNKMTGYLVSGSPLVVGIELLCMRTCGSAGAARVSVHCQFVEFVVLNETLERFFERVTAGTPELSVVAARMSA